MVANLRAAGARSSPRMGAARFILRRLRYIDQKSCGSYDGAQIGAQLDSDGPA